MSKAAFSFWSKSSLSCSFKVKSKSKPTLESLLPSTSSLVSNGNQSKIKIDKIHFECPNCSKRSIHSHSLSCSSSSSAEATFDSQSSSSSSTNHQSRSSNAKGKQREILNQNVQSIQFRQRQQSESISISSPNSSFSTKIQPNSSTSSSSAFNRSCTISSQDSISSKPSKPPIPNSEAHRNQNSIPTSSSQPLWSLHISSNSLDQLLEKAAIQLIQSFNRDRRIDKRNNSSLPSNLHLLQSLLEIQARFVKTFPNPSPSVASGNQDSEKNLWLEELHWLLIGKFLGRNGNGIIDREKSVGMQIEVTEQGIESDNPTESSNSEERFSLMEEEGVEIASKEEEIPSLESSSNPLNLLQRLNPQDRISIAFQIYSFSLDQSNQNQNILPSSNSTSTTTLMKPSRSFTIHYLRKSTLHLLFGSLLNLSQTLSPSEFNETSSTFSSSPLRKASMILRDERLKASHSRYLSRKLISLISKDFIYSGSNSSRNWFSIDGKETLIQLDLSMNSLMEKGNLKFFSSDGCEISTEIKSYLEVLSRFISSSSTSNVLMSSIPKSPSSHISSTKLYNPNSKTSKIKFEKKKRMGMIGERELKLFEKEKGRRIREREGIIEGRRLERERLIRLDEAKWMAEGFLKEFLEFGFERLKDSSSSQSEIVEKNPLHSLICEKLQILLKTTPPPQSFSNKHSLPGIISSFTNFKSNSNPLPQPPRHPIPISHQVALNLLLESIPDQLITQDLLSLFLRCENFSSEIDVNHGSFKQFFDLRKNESTNSRSFSSSNWFRSKKSIQEKRREVSDFFLEKWLALQSLSSLVLKETFENRAVAHSKGRWELVSVPKEARKSWRDRKIILEQEMKIWVWKEGNLKALMKDLEILREFSNKIADSSTSSFKHISSLKQLAEFSESVQFDCILMLARESKWKLVTRASLQCLDSFQKKLEVIDQDDHSEDGKTNHEQFPIKLLNSLLGEILKRRPAKLQFSNTENKDLISSSSLPPVQNSDSPPTSSIPQPAEAAIRPKHRVLKRSTRPSRLDSLSTCINLLETLTEYHSKILKINERTLLILLNALNDWKRSGTISSSFGGNHSGEKESSRIDGLDLKRLEEWSEKLLERRKEIEKGSDEEMMNLKQILRFRKTLAEVFVDDGDEAGSRRILEN